MFFQEKIANS